MIQNILQDYNSPDFDLTMYKHHLDLFHNRRKDYEVDAKYSRERVVYYGGRCVDAGLLTREQFLKDMQPKELTTGNIGSDGDE